MVSTCCFVTASFPSQTEGVSWGKQYKSVLGDSNRHTSVPASGSTDAIKRRREFGYNTIEGMAVMNQYWFLFLFVSPLGGPPPPLSKWGLLYFQLLLQPCASIGSLHDYLDYGQFLCENRMDTDKLSRFTWESCKASNGRGSVEEEKRKVYRDKWQLKNKAEQLGRET